jgi:serine/threonine protein kinase
MLANQDVVMSDSVQSKSPQESSFECERRYERLEKLGEGTYGIVYKSRDR